MRTTRPWRAFLALPLLLPCFFACRPRSEAYTLAVEEGKIFRGVRIEKVWQKELYGRLVVALPQGVFCDEIQDKMGREHKFQFFDYGGRLIREKGLLAGQGPDEVTVVSVANTWLSSAGKIMVDDNDYLKTIDPETFEVSTLAKFANVVKGFGSRFNFGRHTLTTFEERGGRTVTTLESSGFYENMTCYIASYRGLLEDFSIIQKFKLPRPLTWVKLAEGKRESYTDYYHLLRIRRIFAVDWTRDVVYFIPDIEKPEVGFVSFDAKRQGKHYLEIMPKEFGVDRKELEFYHEYVRGQTDPRLKSYYKDILYVPPFGPALIGLKVVGDRLIIVTGKRDWAKQENEALVYRLPSLEYEGSFPIPYPNLQTTRWDDDFYITERLVKRNDDFFYDWEIYRILFD